MGYSCMRYYVGKKQGIIIAEGIISENMGLPDGRGTYKWANPKDITESNMFALPVPEEGTRGMTFEQANEGVLLPIREDVEFPITEEAI